jgi:ribose transport system ATP-binding protein
VNDRPLALNARGLSKSFGGERALDGVDLRLAAGEVVALVGENGSGKSTLVKILAGYHVPESGGALSVSGRDVPLPVASETVREAGLSFVFQDLGLAPRLSVVENLFVGRRLHGARGPIRWRSERRAAQAVLDRYGVAVSPTAIVGELRPTAQALIAIVRAAEDLRAFRAGSDAGGVLVLDEPTVFLPEHEKVFLFDLVRRVVADGTAVLFVSHDMTAVREICDRAVILRDGRLVGDVVMTEVSNRELVQRVSGHRQALGAAAAAAIAAGPTVTAGETALSVSGLSGGRLRDIELTVAAGEIVGVAGLLGSGSEDLPYALFGGLAGASGRMRCGDWSGDVATLNPRRARALGLALVPADRASQAVVPALSIETNMLSLVLGDYARGGTLAHRRIRETASQRCRTFGIRPPDPSRRLGALSGGNQQKVVLARWLELKPRVLLLHEPTQGVDVATRAEIYALMRALAEQGVAMVWVSTDFDELATVCDRIEVCHHGTFEAPVAGPPFTRDRITAQVYAMTEEGLVAQR